MRGVLIATATDRTSGPPSDGAADALTDAGRPVATAAGGPRTSVLDRAWALAEQVALRPEPFGALAYHFGTRRLSFVKDPTLLTVVETLAHHQTARAACAAAGVPPERERAFERALATLADGGMIVERP